MGILNTKIFKYLKQVSLADLFKNIKVVKKFQEEINVLNEKLQSHERVKKFILSEEEWTVENKDLTTSAHGCYL